jgi:hypothetical protein
MLLFPLSINLIERIGRRGLILASMAATMTISVLRGMGTALWSMRLHGFLQTMSLFM